MKPTNKFFVFVYYVAGFVIKLLHPTTVEGLENLPSGGVLLCANHSSNWDPLILATRLPVNYRLHIICYYKKNVGQYVSSPEKAPKGFVF